VSQLTVKAPTDADGDFTLDTAAYPVVTISAPLTNADTVAVGVFLPDGNTAVVATDVNGVITGLTAAVPSRVYPGGPTYVLTSTTTADTGIYADFGSRRV
jgi:hypothetical protein